MQRLSKQFKLIMRIFLYLTLPLLIVACGEQCVIREYEHQRYMEKGCTALPVVKDENNNELLTFSCPTFQGVHTVDYKIKGNLLCHNSTFVFY